MRRMLLGVIVLTFLSCKKSSHNEVPSAKIPLTLKQCMDSFAISYNTYYDYEDRTTKQVIGKLKISADTTITEMYNGREYSYNYSFASNNAPIVANNVGSFAPLTVSFAGKNKANIPVSPTIPISSMAAHFGFQLYIENGLLKVVGAYSYGDNNSWKYNIKR